MGGDYEAVATGEEMAANTVNVNPYTGQVYSDTGNLQNQFLAQLGQLGGSASGLAGQAVQSYNPQAGLAAFLGNAPALQGLALGATNEYAQQQQGLADQLAQQSVEQVAGRFSQAGGLYSGAATQAAIEASAAPRQQALANIVGQQTGLASGLLQQGLGLSQQAQQFGSQNMLQAAALQGQLGSQYAGLLGQGMGILGQMGGAEYLTPQYAYNPGFADYAFGAAGTAAAAAPMFL